MNGNIARAAAVGCLIVVGATWAQPSGKNAAPEPNPLQQLATDPAQQHALFCRQTYYAARRGSIWLMQMQRPDGSYMFGWNPGVNRPTLGGSLVHQAWAAAAIARTSALAHDPDLDRAARRTIVGILANHTSADPARPEVRRPTAPPIQANPVTLAAYMIIAIHELPDPGNELIDRAEELARFVASRQRQDGSLNVCASLDEDTGDPHHLVCEAVGPALYAIIRSDTLAPAPWKQEMLQRALPVYRNYFRQTPALAFVSWQAMAFTEMFFATNEVPYAEFVLEMTDWVTQFQYQGPNAEEHGWRGGFASYSDGAVVMTPPGISTATMLDTLVAGYRVAELVDDPTRRDGYRIAADLAVRFLHDAQFTTTSSDHFQPAFSQRLIGAFHASVENAEVRIDYNSQAIFSLLAYLNFVAGFEPPPTSNDRAN